jgi:EAL domain-containing protein (putative c-di-GMP-specific phosphodiesterase class I)
MAIGFKDLMSRDRTQRFGSDGIAVRCGSQPTQNRAEGLAEIVGGEPYVALFTGRKLQDNLSKFRQCISQADALACSACEITDSGEIDSWHAAPLDQVLHRLNTPWLPDVLENGQIEAHLQPVWSCAEDRICGFEALARSTHKRKPLNGGDLVGAAQAHDELMRFERQAAEAAILKCLPTLNTDERLFVNLLPMSLAAPSQLASSLLDPLMASGMDLSRVVFEVVESEALPPFDIIKESLMVLRRTGAKLAIDDVGAGYSAFSSIIDLQPDIIKLDRSVLLLEERQGPLGLMASLTNIAHSVGIQVVSEGIETAEHLKIARDSGADMLQGWLIGKASPDPQRVPESAFLQI